jgi:hypothetical protein
MSRIFIEFEEAPSAEDDTGRRFNHIHVIYTVNNLWDEEKKVLKF